MWRLSRRRGGGVPVDGPTSRTFSGQSLRGYSKPSAVNDSSKGGRPSRSANPVSAGRPCWARSELSRWHHRSKGDTLADTADDRVAHRPEWAAHRVQPQPKGWGISGGEGKQIGRVHRPRTSRGLGDGRRPPAIDVNQEGVWIVACRWRCADREPRSLRALEERSEHRADRSQAGSLPAIVELDAFYRWRDHRSSSMLSCARWST